MNCAEISAAPFCEVCQEVRIRVSLIPPHQVFEDLIGPREVHPKGPRFPFVENPFAQEVSVKLAFTIAPGKKRTTLSHDPFCLVRTGPNPEAPLAKEILRLYEST